MSQQLGAYLSDLNLRVSRMIMRGTIHSVQEKPPRCRVTLGDDPLTGIPHITDWLPWYAQSDAERSDWDMPPVGAPATVISPNGDPAVGIVLIGLITDNQTPAGSSPTEHVTRYSDGAILSYDTSTHIASLTLPEGGTYSINAPGGTTFNGPVTMVDTLTVKKTAEVKGDLSSGGNISAAGDISDQGDTSSSMTKIRETFDDHDHEYDDGTTGKPNQKF